MPHWNGSFKLIIWVSSVSVLPPASKLILYIYRGCSCSLSEKTHCGDPRRAKKNHTAAVANPQSPTFNKRQILSKASEGWCIFSWRSKRERGKLPHRAWSWFGEDGIAAPFLSQQNWKIRPMGVGKPAWETEKPGVWYHLIVDQTKLTADPPLNISVIKAIFLSFRSVCIGFSVTCNWKDSQWTISRSEVLILSQLSPQEMKEPRHQEQSYGCFLDRKAPEDLET